MKDDQKTIVWSRIMRSGLFQLCVMLLAASVLPTGILYLIDEQTPVVTVRNSALLSVIAAVGALWTFREVVSFPGEERFAYILPIFASAFGLAFAFMLAVRLQYSGTMMTSAFLLCVGCAFLVTQAAAKHDRRRFYLVPEGDVSALTSVTGVEWIALAPNSSPPPHDDAPLVVDLHHDHAPERERMVADEAIAGREVYHTRWMEETLTGRVRIEHMSENSFGSLIPNLGYRKLKRLVDFSIAALLIVVLAIPMLVTSVFIRMDSPGPALFRQVRMGYRGKTFEVIKFRTMAHRREQNPDALREAITQENDARITRLGRFLRKKRIDELPQLINVIRGEMSLIGPRPEAVPLAEWYESELPFYSYRHIVRPGITGWAQVEQGHVAELEDANLKLLFDFFYIKNFSAWLDILIAMRTVGTVFSGFGSK